jgi:hypothetical protein
MNLGSSFKADLVSLIFVKETLRRARIDFASTTRASHHIRDARRFVLANRYSG